MATCDSLHRHQIFDKPPLPQNPTLIEKSISPWNHQVNKPSSNEQPIYHQSSSFTEWHFKDRHHHHPQTSSSSSLMNSESLQVCTEGLGFESSYDIEDLLITTKNDFRNSTDLRKKQSVTNQNHGNRELRRSKSCGGGGGELPPPISWIGKRGNARVSFESVRVGGRFVLKEIRVPTRELLRAVREDGRLKLQFVKSDEEIMEDQGEDEEEGNGDDDDDDGV